jgi:HlyD family secretion protein
MRSFILLLFLGAVAVGAFWIHQNGPPLAVASPPAQSTEPAPITSSLIAAPGLIEPVSEEIHVAAAIGGKLRSLRVKSGDQVARGDILAELQNDAQRARVALSRAQVQQKEAALQRLLNGARPEERGESHARVKQADAVVRNAKAELDRKTALVGRGFASTEETQRL